MKDESINIEKIDVCGSKLVNFYHLSKESALYELDSKVAQLQEFLSNLPPPMDGEALYQLSACIQAKFSNMSLETLDSSDHKRGRKVKPRSSLVKTKHNLFKNKSLQSFDSPAAANARRLRTGSLLHQPTTYLHSTNTNPVHRLSKELSLPRRHSQGNEAKKQQSPPSSPVIDKVKKKPKRQGSAELPANGSKDFLQPFKPTCSLTAIEMLGETKCGSAAGFLDFIDHDDSTSDEDNFVTPPLSARTRRESISTPRNKRLSPRLPASPYRFKSYDAIRSPSKDDIIQVETDSKVNGLDVGGAVGFLDLFDEIPKMFQPDLEPVQSNKKKKRGKLSKRGLMKPKPKRTLSFTELNTKKITAR